MTESQDNNDPIQINDQNMHRLNTIASILGITTVFLFLITLLIVFYFPHFYSQPPANTKLPNTPTRTPTLTLTPTLTMTPTVPPPTSTPVPLVELLSVEYLQPGVGCQVDISVNVSGDPLTGAFHVWNASYQDPVGNVISNETLPSGTTNNHFITLPGDQPQFYTHEVWFEYDGGQSNRLSGLVCPELTPGP